MKLKKRWIGVGAGVVVVILLVVLLSGGSAVQVELAEVRRDTVKVVVLEEGQTRLRDTYLLAAPVAGRLERIHLREGDEVGQGALVARIYPTPTDRREDDVNRARLTAAEARRDEIASRLTDARARAEQASREAERRAGLAESGVLAREAVERAQLEAESARRQLEALNSSLRAAQAEVASARAILDGAGGRASEALPVFAPAAGRVLRVMETSERVVAPGTPLIEVGDAGGLEIVVDVLTTDAVQIEPGDPVEITEWGGGYPLTGRVRLVEPSAFTEISALGVEEQRVNVLIDLDRTPAELGAGYRVQAAIATWIGSDVLAVPTGALFQQDGSWYAFVADGGEAVRTEVQLGERSADAAVVEAGLEEGDRVILFPSGEIEDGTAISG